MYSILVVDDEKLTRDFLQTNIPRWKERWEVRSVAIDGRDAWEMMQQERYDLVITDIKMSEMDGLELCRLIAARFPQQKIIILSGYDEFPLAQEAIRYGVDNYLLKPILKEELTQALDMIERELEQSSTNELALQAMKSVSEMTHKQVIKQFLAAAATGNDIDVKTLHPLMYRLKVNLIEADAAVMVLALDENVLLAQSGAASDSSVFRFIVRQMAEELAEELGLGIVFNDTEQNTCVFVTGEDERHIAANCRRLYEPLSEALLRHTKLTITGAIGTAVSDVLQLDVSYRHARDGIQMRLIHGTGKLYGYDADPGHTSRDQALIREIDHCLLNIGAALREPDEWAYLAPLRQYADCIEPVGVRQAQLFGIAMIRYVESVRTDKLPEQTEAAINALKKLAIYNDRLTRENVVDIFKEALQRLRGGHAPNGWDEQDMVARAKAYICEHYGEPISLALIAEKIGVSSAYLSSVFSQRHQEGYIKFLTRIRMEQAAKLLKQSSRHKIADIAAKVGYLSSKHFSHVFKQHYGMPPGEFQEKYRSS
ncbi:Regulator of RpoS [Paenibacillus sp. CECT 9249]|uniref:response regulator n=1 Tax=Paenibacillus sp. CECT 9249 TaxID=2845385 RepID=UPI001E4FF0B2|nr:response regulator [Paenibacillus sp. CECT 9249]CAH0120651.1 Regulator of RpoS [Paenibacillus sp. CECT 9249]